MRQHTIRFSNGWLDDATRVEDDVGGELALLLLGAAEEVEDGGGGVGMAGW